jgi:hypothetical protein
MVAREERPAILTAFIGRSFEKSDSELWNEVRAILDNLRPLGLKFEDAKEAQARPISAKVQEGIGRNEIYIGILSKRHPIDDSAASGGSWRRRLRAAFASRESPLRWVTSFWVVQESGYALGRGKEVIGVDPVWWTVAKWGK